MAMNSRNPQKAHPWPILSLPTEYQIPSSNQTGDKEGIVLLYGLKRRKPLIPPLLIDLEDRFSEMLYNFWSSIDRLKRNFFQLNPISTPFPKFKHNWIWTQGHFRSKNNIKFADNPNPQTKFHQFWLVTSWANNFKLRKKNTWSKIVLGLF